MEPIHDLRSYIAVLENAAQLTRIESVNLVHELANVAAEVARQDRGGTFLKQQLGSDWSVFAGAVATQKLASLALGCDVSEVTEIMGQALDPANGVTPETQVTNAVWKANVIVGDDVDLRKVPIPTHGKNDGGPFIR